MSCLHVHDFIAGTAIALPRATIGQSADRETLDILRPNRKAATLVSRHVEVLSALDIDRKLEVAIH